MTYTPIQLEIVRVFGKKDISNGLQIIISENRCETCSPSDYCGNKIHHYLSLDKNLVFEVDGYEYTIQSFQQIYAYENPTMSMEILGHIPHLEDMFRAAEEDSIKCSVEISMYTGKLKLFIDDNSIEYNPSIPLLEQSESTLLELLKLFK